MKTLPAGLTALFSTAVAAADSIPGQTGNILITPLIHSSVQLEYRDKVVQIDPWDRVDLVGAKPADLILITDDVGHHLDPAAISKLRKPAASVLITEAGRDRVPDGVIMSNGDTRQFSDVTVEAIAAYDIIPGEPSHPKGEANGYIVTPGGKRFYFAGVTECVPELQELGKIDVAFMPLNIPLGRMTPAATAECTRMVTPDVVYFYHYDQDYARRAVQPAYVGPGLPGDLSVDETIELFESMMAGSGIEIRRGDFYPDLNP